MSRIDIGIIAFILSVIGLFMGIYLSLTITDVIAERKTIKTITKNANKDYIPLSIYKKKEKSKMKDDLGIQKRISELLKDGWSYRKIADKVGVSKTTIGRWARGECEPKNYGDIARIDRLYEDAFGLIDMLEASKVFKTKDEPTFKVGDRVEICQGKDFPKITNVTLDGICVKDIPSEVIFDIPIFETIDEEIRYHEEELAKLNAQKEKGKWKFTEDEKVILRNLPKEYKWIRRVCGTSLLVHKTQSDSRYCNWGGIDIDAFNHLFKCLENGDEPCEFRKFI